MSWSLLILIICAGFALGAAVRLWRSPNTDPYANLARDGHNVDAKIVGIEESGAWYNIAVQYEVSSTQYRRTLAWPSMNAKPALGATVELRYLSTNPGLSRLA